LFLWVDFYAGFLDLFFGLVKALGVASLPLWNTGVLRFAQNDKNKQRRRQRQTQLQLQLQKQVSFGDDKQEPQLQWQRRKRGGKSGALGSSEVGEGLDDLGGPGG
jgi:hypothetical protein